MDKRKILLSAIFVVAGGLLGFLYWRFIGCNSGSCPITSKWPNTTLYGGLLGYLLGSSVMDMVNKKKKIQNNEEVS